MTAKEFVNKELQSYSGSGKFPNWDGYSDSDVLDYANEVLARASEYEDLGYASKVSWAKDYVKTVSAAVQLPPVEDEKPIDKNKDEPTKGDKIGVKTDIKPAPKAPVDYTRGLVQANPAIGSYARVWNRIAPYWGYFVEYGKEFGVDPLFALAVAQQESGGQQWRSNGTLVQSVIKDKQTGKLKHGAIGIMQLMPDTAASLKVDPSNPVENIKGGIKYLGSAIKQHNGDYKTALVHYNAGPKRAQQYIGAGNNLGVLPLETQRYVPNVMRMYNWWSGPGLMLLPAGADKLTKNKEMSPDDNLQAVAPETPAKKDDSGNFFTDVFNAVKKIF